MSVHSMLKKLQFALRQKGFIITISQNQFYLQTGKRYLTMHYIRHNGRELFRSSSKIKVVKYLSELLKIIDSKPKTTRMSLDNYVAKKLKENVLYGTQNKNKKSNKKGTTKTKGAKA